MEPGLASIISVAVGDVEKVLNGSIYRLMCHTMPEGTNEGDPIS